MLIKKIIGDDYMPFTLPGSGRNKKLTGTSTYILMANMNNNGLLDILLRDLVLNRNIWLINEGGYEVSETKAGWNFQRHIYRMELGTLVAYPVISC